MRRQRYRPTKPEVWYPIPLSIRSKSVSPCPALRLPNGSFRTCVVEQPNHFSLAPTLGVFLRECQCGVPINVLLVYKRPRLAASAQRVGNHFARPASRASYHEYPAYLRPHLSQQSICSCVFRRCRRSTHPNDRRPVLRPHSAKLKITGPNCLRV